jgi:hypothetical protein
MGIFTVIGAQVRIPMWASAALRFRMGPRDRCETRRTIVTRRR